MRSSFYISAAVYLLLKYTGGASEAAQDGPAQGQCSVHLLRVAVGLSVLSLLVGWAQARAPPEAPSPQLWRALLMAMFLIRYESRR